MACFFLQSKLELLSIFLRKKNGLLCLACGLIKTIKHNLSQTSSVTWHVLSLLANFTENWLIKKFEFSPILQRFVQKSGDYMANLAKLILMLVGSQYVHPDI